MKMAKVSGQRKIYEMINNRIIGLLEKGEIPWKKPWVSGDPVNFITRKPYRGINPFILISSGFSCPYWVSFKQAKGKGGRIKKGENGRLKKKSVSYALIHCKAFDYNTLRFPDAPFSAPPLREIFFSTFFPNRERTWVRFPFAYQMR